MHMDGILTINGYKFNEKLHLNFQKYTILFSNSDYYTPIIIFDFIEKFFCKNDFSDKYLDKNIYLAINEKYLKSRDRKSVV